MESRISTTNVRCTTCESEINIGNGGRDDIKKHIASKKHKAAQSVASTPAITGFIKPNPEDEQVTRAEALFATFLMEHNIPLSVGDHATQLFKKMFPQCKIAKKISSGRTKTTSLIRCMADNSVAKLVQRIRTCPFSVATDGSNDGGANQLYPSKSFLRIYVVIYVF